MSGFDDFNDNSAETATYDHQVEDDEIRQFVEEVGAARIKEVLFGDLHEVLTDEVTRLALSAIRGALANILNPSKGSSASLEATVIGLAIGYPGLVSMTHQARLHGVGKAAMSKRVVAYCEQNGMPPSPYMKSRRARDAYRASNTRKRKRNP